MHLHAVVRGISARKKAKAANRLSSAHRLLPPANYCSLCCLLEFSDLRVGGHGDLLFTNKPDSFSQTQKLQRADTIPVDVNFVPCQAVSGGARMCVMVVVPALTKC